MDGEVVIQVKVGRKDIYDAVRNLLLNEFKIIPADLSLAVEQKVSSRVDHAVQTTIQNTYGFGTKINTAANAVTEKLRKDAQTLMTDEVLAAVREIITPQVMVQTLREVLKELVK